jgi:hypothetical protein
LARDAVSVTKKYLEITGGDKLKSYLKDLAKKISHSGVLNVGFLEGSSERKGNIPSALVALWNEFGGTATIPEHDVTVYRQVDDNGDFMHGGKFVKKHKSNFSTTHHVDEYTATRPPRPFFRRMIARGKGHWGDDLGKILQARDYDVEDSLDLMGTKMDNELKDSIQANVYAPLAKSTVDKKGNDQQLIDSGDMINNVNHEVIV